MVTGGEIRKTEYAGSFYPGDALDLSKMMDELFREADDGSPIDPRKPKALIVPHAGYMYSGVIAAKAYRQVEDKQYSRVLLMGPYHYHPMKGHYFQGPAPAHYEKLESPIGDIKYDSETAAMLASELKVEYQQGAHSGEHSLEVQLPMIGRCLPGIPVSLLLMGDFDLADTSRAAEAIEKIADKDDYLILISTDLSHFYPYKKARELDEQSLQHIERGELDELFDWDRNAGGLLCGVGGVLTAMQIAKKKGWQPPVRLGYQTSGDRGGSKQEVVGYAAMAYYEE
jgi:AmmeMemoRadiSam system protein B